VPTDERSIRDRAGGDRGRAGVIGVIGRCSAPGCCRPAARHVELPTARAGTIRGAVCERCARVSSAAAFLLDLIA
jgi:hypothetical protein